MADWVHCNSCFRQPGTVGGLKFFLTSCGHIFCSECISKVSDSKCLVCGNHCNTTALSGKMSPEVGIFFLDPLSLLKKHYKQMVQVFDFQKNHRLRLFSYNKQLVSRQNSIMDKVQSYHKAVQQIQQLEKEILVLRQENSYLKKAISGSRNGSPCVSNRSSPQVIRSNSSNSLATRMLTQSSQVSASDSSSRITVRTPPNHGRMGIIPGSTPPVYDRSPRRFDLQVKEVATPNPYDPETPRRLTQYSPMQTSPKQSKLYPR